MFSAGLLSFALMAQDAPKKEASSSKSCGSQKACCKSSASKKKCTKEEKEACKKSGKSCGHDKTTAEHSHESNDKSE
jgi:hypothetical protein